MNVMFRRAVTVCVEAEEEAHILRGLLRNWIALDEVVP